MMWPGGPSPHLTRNCSGTAKRSTDEERDPTLCNDSEDELADLAAEHALSVHGHKPPREHVMAGIRHHNR